MKVQPIVGTRVCLAWLPAPPPLLLLFLLLFPLLELFLVLFLLRLLHMYLLLVCCSLSSYLLLTFLSFLSCSSSFFSPSPSTSTCTCSPCKHLTDLALVPRTKHTPRVRIARPVDCDGLLRCECFSLFSLVQIMIKFPVNFLIEARQMKLLQLIESLHAA